MLSGKIFNKGVIEGQEDSASSSISENNISYSYKRFSNSEKTDNIAFPFQAKDGYYVIKLEDEDIGKPLKNNYIRRDYVTSYVLYNDKISISNYSNISEGGVTLHGLWGEDYIRISKRGSVGLPTDSSYSKYSVIKNVSDYYLMSETTSSNKVNYYIYILNSAKDYTFKVNLYDSENLEKITNVFNKFTQNTEICYAKFDKEDNFQGATKSITDSENVDISQWTFLPDLISNYFAKHGINFVNSVEISNFNYNHNNDVYTYQMYYIDGEAYRSGFKITEMDEDYFEETADEEKRKKRYTSEDDAVKEIKLNGFDRSFVFSSSYGSDRHAKLVVKSGDSFYLIETAISYRKGNKNEEMTNNLINICNQIFAKTDK